MPWITRTTMSQRHEFVRLASEAGVNFRQLCGRFRISPKTGDKWQRRFRAGGVAALTDQSRRPKSSPRSCASAVGAAVAALRQAEPTWGGRKLRRRLQDLQHPQVPAASTCTAILRRAHLLAPAGGTRHTAWQRFERAQPNELLAKGFQGPCRDASGLTLSPAHRLGRPQSLQRGARRLRQ